MNKCVAIARTTGGSCKNNALPGMRYCLHHTEKIPILVAALAGGVGSLVVAEAWNAIVPTKESVKLQELQTQNAQLVREVEKAEDLLRPDDIRFWVAVSVPGTENEEVTRALTSPVLLSGYLRDTPIAVHLEPHTAPESRTGRRTSARSMLYRFLSKRTDLIGYPTPLYRAELEGEALSLRLDNKFFKLPADVKKWVYVDLFVREEHFNRKHIFETETTFKITRDARQ